MTSKPTGAIVAQDAGADTIQGFTYGDKNTAPAWKQMVAHLSAGIFSYKWGQTQQSIFKRYEEPEPWTSRESLSPRLTSCRRNFFVFAPFRVHSIYVDLGSLTEIRLVGPSVATFPVGRTYPSEQEGPGVNYSVATRTHGSAGRWKWTPVSRSEGWRRCWRGGTREGSRSDAI